MKKFMFSSDDPRVKSRRGGKMISEIFVFSRRQHQNPCAWHVGFSFLTTKRGCRKIRVGVNESSKAARLLEGEKGLKAQSESGRGVFV
jgi:hypothetical protein